MSRPRAAIVITGSELVRGARYDANGPFLAAEVLRLGFEPRRIHIVGDAEAELRIAIEEALESELILTSGGLGPTHDDRTIPVLAASLSLALIVDEGLVGEIGGISRGFAKRMGRPYADFAAGVEKQATLPVGAESLGLAGTAPGVLIEHERGVAVALPGPPGELQRLWVRAAAHPAVMRLTAGAAPREHRALRFFGPSESAVAKVIDEAGGEAPGLEVTVCARDLEIHVDLLAEAGSQAEADVLEDALVAQFGEALFTRDERRVEELVLERCRALGWTLGTAESCTGGLVGAHLTEVPGASAAFQGSVIAYANTVKSGQLGVDPAVLQHGGAVSADAAAAMACGVRDTLGVDVGASVTGIAGPGGGTPDKPVGLVFLHVETPRGSKSRRLEIPGDRETVRRRATASLLHLTLRAILSPSGSIPA
ncbi:MAG: nicotinamide-nucleotide amidohydrolase family protein [Actinomycetia bacterium]|nr:nicotinamide-nucleotide amidohydrolase family protein [Actinomycetes bacterium]